RTWLLQRAERPDSSYPAGRSHHDVVLLEQLVQVLAVHVGLARGARDVALGARKQPAQVAPLELVGPLLFVVAVRHARIEYDVEIAAAGLAAATCDVQEADHAAGPGGAGRARAPQIHRALEHVAQLAHVARPVVRKQDVHGLRAQPRRLRT